MEKIKQFFKKNKRIVCIILGIGSVAAGSIAGVAYRERRRRTDIPTPKYDSGERGINRIAQSVHSGIRDTIERTAGNLEKMDDYQQRVGELHNGSAVTVEELTSQLEGARRRNVEFAERIQRITNSARGLGYSIDRLGGLRSDALDISQTIADTISNFERKSGLGDTGDREPETEPLPVRNPDGII